MNYRDQDVAAEVRRIAPDGVHSIVEVSPSANAALDAAVLAAHGSVAVYANNGGDEFTVPSRPLMAINARWQFVLLYTAPAGAKARAIEDVSAAVLDGAARVGEAAVEHSTVGKVLIDVSD